MREKGRESERTRLLVQESSLAKSTSRRYKKWAEGERMPGGDGLTP